MLLSVYDGFVILEFLCHLVPKADFLFQFVLQVSYLIVFARTFHTFVILESVELLFQCVDVVAQLLIRGFERLVFELKLLILLTIAFQFDSHLLDFSQFAPHVLNVFFFVHLIFDLRQLWHSVQC